MAFRFLKNAIITGHIDAYCLVCESHLRSTDDVHCHVVKPIHIKNLDSTGYFEKYKDDCVRKVKKGYFCEYCNILLPTAAKVGLHVVERMHVDNKGAQHLKRIGSFIIAFDNVLINEKAWNGVKEDTCLICGVEFDNEGIHKTEAMHIINLIQSNIEFEGDNTVYRKIDESSFQCLTCNDVFALKTMATHFDDADHKILYTECREAYIAYVANEKPPVEVSKVGEKPKTSVTTAKEEKPDPENESKKEIPNPAKKPDSLEVNKELIADVSPKNPITPLEPAKQATPELSAKNSSTPTERAKKSTPVVKTPEIAKPRLEKGTLQFDVDICRALNAVKYIARDDSGQTWCILCDWTVDYNEAAMHTESKHHQTMLKMHKERIEKLKGIKLGSDKCASAQAEQKPQEIRSPILDMLPKLENNDIMVDCKSNVAFCKRCSKALEFNHLAIENHIIEQHKEDEKEELKKPSNNNKKAEEAKKTLKTVEDNKKPQSPITKKAQAMKKQERDSESRASSAASTQESDDDIEKFAKANNLAFNRNNNKVYCSVCDVHMTAILRNISQHISSATHKNHATTKSTKPNLTKSAMQDYITDVIALESGYTRDMIINNKYVISYHSFVMITKLYRLKCAPCEVYLNPDQVEKHRISPNHHRAMCETMVIASFESEFIRELRPDVYHCGYCNFVLTSYQDLENHLQSTTHREAKGSSMWRLHQYGPEILNHRSHHPPAAFVVVPDLLNVRINREE